jgi:hypothetical protein
MVAIMLLSPSALTAFSAVFSPSFLPAAILIVLAAEGEHGARVAN